MKPRKVKAKLEKMFSPKAPDTIGLFNALNYALGKVSSYDHPIHYRHLARLRDMAAVGAGKPTLLEDEDHEDDIW